MPPKKTSAPTISKKTETKKKDKVIEDKTFGLKNKKGTKQQKFIQQVQKQVKSSGVNRDILPNAAVVKKEEKKKELDELNALFRPVTTAQKVEKGVDPKSVLCAFFKSGQCGKGDKCKFSHDVAIERKGQKRNVYEDVRQEDTMEDWDQEKLQEVVNKKHEGKGMPTTDIICKHFIDALETNKYGWFWECPSGGDKCHYRHCLPPGFVLSKDRKKHDKKDDITIEELVEIERAKLGYNLTKITLETFLDWKRRKVSEKVDKDIKDNERKRAEFKAGKNVGLSGREMFTFNPDLAIDEDIDDGEATFDFNNRELDDDDDGQDMQFREITLEALISEAKASDGTGTQMTGKREFDVPIDKTQELVATGGTDEETIESPPIDETLFEDFEDLDDLDGLGEDVNSISLEK